MPERQNWRGRVRPGRSTSLLGMVVGIGMAIFALSMMGGAMGAFGGPFLLLFVVVTLGMAAFHGYNYFSERGAAIMEVDLDLPGRSGGAAPTQGPAGGGGHQSARGAAGDFAERLRKLERLRDDRLLTEDEYRAKRAEILNDKW